jgi:curved DNA-binding protein CbpA
MEPAIWRDYYELLGISRWASAAEVLDAYDECEDILREQYADGTVQERSQAGWDLRLLREARDVLIDPRSRAAYDQAWQARHPLPPPPPPVYPELLPVAAEPGDAPYAYRPPARQTPDGQAGFPHAPPAHPDAAAPGSVIDLAIYAFEWAVWRILGTVYGAFWGALIALGIVVGAAAISFSAIEASLYPFAALFTDRWAFLSQLDPGSMTKWLFIESVAAGGIDGFLLGGAIGVDGSFKWKLLPVAVVAAGAAGGFLINLLDGSWWSLAGFAILSAALFRLFNSRWSSAGDHSV